MYKNLNIVIIAVLLVVFGLLQFFSAIPAVDNLVHDNIITATRNATDDIIIVGIDERSINEIGSLPWPRFFMAEAINQLNTMGAAAIGVNILYDSFGMVPEYDQELIYAAANAESLVLGGLGVLSTFQYGTGLLELDNFIVPFGELGENTTIGFLNAIPDEIDGVMRHGIKSFRFGDITVHSFPFEVYRTFRRNMNQPEIENIPLSNHGQFPIRYVGGPQSFTSVSFWGLINGYYSASLFENKIVLIGPYAHGIGDGSFTTPAERQIATHGIEIYANIIQNFLEGIIISHAPFWLNLIVLVISGAIVIFLYQNLKLLLSFFATFALIIALYLWASFAYNNLLMIVSIGTTAIFLVICYFSHMVVSIIKEQKDKQEIKSLFGRFVAPEVVNEIIARGVDIQLGGVVKDLTALFVDVRGFTAYSEANPPEKVVSIINKYLEFTSLAIHRNRGTIDKFIGDATMALFNAPNDLENHAIHAVRAAWEMKVGSAELRKEMIKEFGADLEFGIGINTGVAVVGNMGSEFRMDYTAIGDTINTAARLEGNAERGQIIISDATYQLVKPYVEVKELGTINFKNKNIGILVYSVENVLPEGDL